MSAVEKVPTGESNPLYGCAILVIVMSILGGIASWVVYSGLKQNQEIGEFAVDVADPLPVAEVSQELRTALQEKLKVFGAGSATAEGAALNVDTQELNALIVLAAEAGIADYRGMVRFTGMDAAGQTLLADLCWPLNRLSFKDKSKRYLVGQAAFSPYIENGSFDLRIVTVSVPGKDVSPGFLKGLGNWPWLNLAKLNPQVAEAMKRTVRFAFDGERGVFRLDAKAAKDGEKR